MKFPDITWSSAAKYLQWLEVVLDLKQQNTSHIWSLRLGVNETWEKVLSRKVRLEASLLDNANKLKSYQARNALTDREGQLVDVFIYDIERAITVVSDHVMTLEGLKNYTQSGMAYEVIETSEDIPF